VSSEVPKPKPNTTVESRCFIKGSERVQRTSREKASTPDGLVRTCRLVS